MYEKYAVILGNLGNTCDRFLSSGYKSDLSKDDLWKQVAAMPEVSGIELVGTWDIDETNYKEVKRRLTDLNLTCASVIPDTFSQKVWGRGSYSAPDPEVRRKSVSYTKEMVDIAVEIGCDLLNLWPGQDGYDYPLAADFREERGWLLEALTECAAYAESKGVRLALEYKVKEPRTHSYLARAADTLLVAREIGRANVGVTIDTGHAFVAYENVGESIVLLSMFGDKLFHIHFNDNHSSWDDDMIAGSVRLVEYFEILYWLRETGYSGWYSMDQYPYREDARGAIHASILFLRKLDAILDRVGIPAVKGLLAKRDPVATAQFIRENLIA
jgi:sugar phosphate isomerase/epimerase